VFIENFELIINYILLCFLKIMGELYPALCFSKIYFIHLLLFVKFSNTNNFHLII